MASHTAQVEWALQPGEDFASGRYSRGHTLSFDGGARLAGSASPSNVGAWAVEAAVDPEEMLVAALSACHMLTVLHVARNAGFRISAYRDAAEGEMGEIAPGRHAVTRVVLRPRIDWDGTAPDPSQLAALHAEAHAACFIANSVRAEVVVACGAGRSPA